MSRRLVARLDNMGDVLMTGPAVRAVAASGDPVTYLAGPSGAGAAQLLPGVDEVLVFDAPWVSYDAPRVDEHALAKLVKSVASRRIDEAFIFTSFHQSPLPLALLLRQAGVGWIGATCVDYPGTLLDLRHPYEDDLHEVEQSLELVYAAGHRLPFGDHRRLALSLPPVVIEGLPRPYVVVHPGASVPARALPPRVTRQVVGALVQAGHPVVLTGSAAEAELIERAVPAGSQDSVTTLAGSLGLEQLAHVLRSAEALICGNTGPVHLSAAVGTPVVEAFAPVVPAHRWRPWGVPHVLLGDLGISCAGCRARVCPRQGQPCLEPFGPESVLAALGSIGASREVLT
jgi:ADP-heptose:LPS heptosyltransferase